MKIGPANPWFKVGGKLCENPLWDAEARKLYWTDIDSGHLWSSGVQNGATPERIYQGEKVGGFTRQADGSLLLFRVNDVALLPPGGEVRRLFGFFEAGSKRFNDVIADPEGRVFAGTIGQTDTSGGLFRFERQGRYTQVAWGTGCANGMAFSPALDTFYWVCSTRRRIYKYPYRRSTGELGTPEIFYQAGEGDGIPDGMTADAEGNLYLIHWTASQYGLVVFAPDGTVLDRRVIPPKASSSLCFFGPELKSLAITSAADPSDPDREADLYKIKEMPIAGRLEFRSRMEA